MDYILLSNINFFAFHGVGEQETKVGNTFLIDIKIGVDLSKAFISDNIDDTINYSAVYDIVKKVMETPCKLLERVAEKICKELKIAFNQIEYLEIKLTKINPPIMGQMDSASVILIR